MRTFNILVTADELLAIQTGLGDLVMTQIEEEPEAAAATKLLLARLHEIMPAGSHFSS